MGKSGGAGVTDSTQPGQGCHPVSHLTHSVYQMSVITNKQACLYAGLAPRNLEHAVFNHTC